MKLNHLLIPYLAALLFIFGSVLSSGGIIWYRTLILPSWAPSEGMIAFLWAVIYALMTRAVLIIWNQDHRDKRFRYMVALLVTAALINLLWSLLFFGAQLITASVVMALLLAAVLIVLMLVVGKRSKKAAYFIAPFLLWVLFAAYFTYTLSVLNV